MTPIMITKIPVVFVRISIESHFGFTKIPVRFSRIPIEFARIPIEILKITLEFLL